MVLMLNLCVIAICCFNDSTLLYFSSKLSLRFGYLFIVVGLFQKICRCIDTIQHDQSDFFAFELNFIP